MQVTGQLWQLVVVHAELPAHLAALKNYFLLAKGDFYHSFLAEVSHNAHHTVPSQLLGKDKVNAQHVQSADMIVECCCCWPCCESCMLNRPKQQQVMPNSFLPAAHQSTVNVSVFWLSLTLSMFAADLLCWDLCPNRCQQA